MEIPRTIKELYDRYKKKLWITTLNYLRYCQSFEHGFLVVTIFQMLSFLHSLFTRHKSCKLLEKINWEVSLYLESENPGSKLLSMLAHKVGK
jgi:hypothetical protein